MPCCLTSLPGACQEQEIRKAMLRRLQATLESCELLWASGETERSFSEPAHHRKAPGCFALRDLSRNLHDAVGALGLTAYNVEANPRL